MTRAHWSMMLLLFHLGFHLGAVVAVIEVAVVDKVAFSMVILAAMDSVAVIQAVVDVDDVENVENVEDIANEPNAVVEVVAVHDKLNAEIVAPQTVGQHFDWHQLRGKEIMRK